jgi:hypothetical protein
MGTLDNITTVLVSLSTVLFSAGAWRFYENRLKIKSKAEISERTEQNMYRDDLKDRVRRLEQLLTESTKKENEMTIQIIALTKEVSELRVKVLFLEKENDRLKNI